MRFLSVRSWFVGLSLWAGALLALSVSEVPGQTGTASKSKKTTAGSKKSTPQVSPAQMQELEVRAKKAREQYIRDAFDLSREYEQAGLLEESKSMLQSMLRLDADLPGVKEKIDQINESILSRNDSQIDLDVSKGWGDPIGRVEKDRPVRIKAAGTYKFSAQATLTPLGYPSGDPVKEMARGVTCGALMAIIVPIDDRGRPGKPGQPIEIGTEKEITPRETGLLFLSVNAPPEHRSTGKLTVELSGYVQTQQTQKP